MRRPEVILVHGLYHQPAHMRPLVEALEVRGVVVHAPLLHRGSLEADTSAVQRVVDDCLEEPIVVGHSYGGAVAAGLPGAASFLFMAAFVPEAGESCAQLGGPDAPVNAWVLPHSAGGTYIPAGAATDLFYGDCAQEAAREAVDLLLPQAPGHGRGVVATAAWKHAPSHFIVCSNDHAMRPELQRRMAARCTTSETITASHSPYISQPARVAESVLRNSNLR